METPGLVRISKSSAVTDSAGLALAASEKNASLEGTLASEIRGISESLELFGKLERIRFLASGTEYTIEFELGKTYLATVNNAYNAGPLWLISTGANASVARVVAIASDSYFTAEGSGKNRIKIKSGNADGWLCSVCIAR